MIPPTRIQILKLYKHLVRYSNNLQFTDKKYFMKKVRTEFKEGKSLENPKDIEFAFKVRIFENQRCFKVYIFREEKPFFLTEECFNVFLS